MPLPPARGLHPWHDIPTGPNPPAEVTAVIEIPTNERNKYELDKELGVFRLDRVLSSAVHYPGDSGFLPRTFGDDGDPLDVLVLADEALPPGAVVPCRIVGVIEAEQHDEGEAETKRNDRLLAVAVRSHRHGDCCELDDLPANVLAQIE